jgi:hypothetical protein
MAKLKGQALLEYLDANKGYDRDKLIEGAGYTSKRGEKVSLQRTQFFEALAAANGHQLGPVPAKMVGGLKGKDATYRLKVGPGGLVPVSRAYTDQCGMTPGSYVTVIIEDGAIVLEKVEADASAAPADACPAPAAAPPAASLETVA